MEVSFIIFKNSTSQLVIKLKINLCVLRIVVADLFVPLTQNGQDHFDSPLQNLMVAPP